jgi:hypothetical protein
MYLSVDILLPPLPSQTARQYTEVGKPSEALGYSGVWAPGTAGLAARDNGFPAAVRPPEEAGAHGDRDGARDALPDELIEQMVTFGPKERVWAGLDRLVAAGVERLLVMPVTASRDALGACTRMIQALAPPPHLPPEQGA